MMRRPRVKSMRPMVPLTMRSLRRSLLRGAIHQHHSQGKDVAVDQHQKLPKNKKKAGL
jgi:hypothetical protein